MAKCLNCGMENKENAKFCASCGSSLSIETENNKQEEKIDNLEKADETKEETTIVEENETLDDDSEKKTRKKRQPKEKPLEVEKISENISRYSDGTYRWVHEFNLYRNPGIFFTVWKIFFFIMLAGFLIGFFASLGSHNFFWKGFLEFSKGWLIAFAVMTVVTYSGYILYALIMGGKYCVIFEMNETGIKHIQMAKQVKKAQALSALTVLAGLASGRPSTVAIGVNSGVKTTSTTDFSKVRRLKITKVSKILKLNELIEHNQVYFAKEDADFVIKYITQRCTNAKNYKKMYEKYCK